MQKVLVTGGAGFIGANLVRRLLADGCEVTVLDNFYSGRRCNLENLNGNWHLLEADVADFQTNQRFDAIYHLACPASPPFYQKKPLFTTRTCVEGTWRMLELATESRCPLLISSTSEVYGDPLVHPQNEEYRGNVNCTGIRSCYDEGKRCAESIAFDFVRTWNTQVKVVRIFNTYGPYMRADDGRVISNFINQALRNEPISVYGDGTQTRSICFVEDLLNGFLKMMASPKEFHGPINLGTPCEETVKDLALRIIRLTGSKSELVFRPLPVDDPKRRRPDITLAGKILSWKPEIPLDEGLKHTIDYYRSCL